MLGDRSSGSGVENPRLLLAGRLAELEAIKGLLSLGDDCGIVGKLRLHCDHIGLAVKGTVGLGSSRDQRHLRRINDLSIICCLGHGVNITLEE